MDRIEIKDYRTKYSKSEYPMIFINDCSIDELLSNHFDNENIYGLVPSMTWLWNESELEFTIKRFSCDIIGSTNVPLLVCPDDADFSCTVLFVEVEMGENTVRWNRFGFDQSPRKEIGTTLQWLKGGLHFEFNNTEYVEFRNTLIKLL